MKACMKKFLKLIKCVLSICFGFVCYQIINLQNPKQPPSNFLIYWAGFYVYSDRIKEWIKA